MSTQALGTFGVYGPPSQDEIDVLVLASQYREELVALLHERHRASIDYRNERFPNLWDALVECEHLKALIWQIEREIKEHHSELRDRNAVTKEQEIRLRHLRAELKQANKAMREERQKWFDHEKAFREFFKKLEDWKNVKDYTKRKAIYAAIDWPEEVADYGRLWIDYDQRQRELGLRYQSLGLHFTIRAEINDASKPKLSKTGPGMRYQYHRTPQPKEWQKITLQIVGGLKVADAIEGKSRVLSMTPVYSNNKASGPQTLYDVSQQIGTKDGDRLLVYRVKFHRPLPDDAIVQRWTLKVDGEKRYCIPILKNHGLTKQTGQGTIAYDLTWRRCKDGIQVCHFWGDHINEALVIPQWLIERRLAVKTEQAACDSECNALLMTRGDTPQANERQGMAALEVYAAKHHDDPRLANKLADCNRRMKAARKLETKAIRTIETIYEMVAHRVAKLHSHLVADEIDLCELKRYDTRDLLTRDRIPRKSREYLAAVAPGKLSARLKQSGLARGEAADDFQGVTRTTDVFTRYIRSLGVSTGAKEQAKNHRSQHEPQLLESD